MSGEGNLGPRQYFGVFAALMVLLLVTILLAMKHLGPANTAVAMSVATLKTFLVMAYFMHLRYAAKLAWLFAAGSAFWLAILIAGTFNDYDSRDWFTGRLGNVAPPEVTGAVGESIAAEAKQSSTPATSVDRPASEHAR
ncbi:MAG TPA: cytochrome C oxidase subunit IV family protein [Pirellulales bacterium]|nr:cytochrome C oxidase subunit IV family protein [Pirellulales bacterium]